MARNRVHIDATPGEVFAVLSDPECYPKWVVGAAGIRDQDEEFPAVGSRFHHKVGSWPIGVKDHTEVIEAEPPRRLVLKAKARPLGTATIALDLQESEGGTELRMEEVPGDRLTSLLIGNPVADTALRVRNAEALTRLKRLVEGTPEGDPIRKRELANQRVLITGGSSGIGLAVAEALAQEGAEVALLARNELGLAAAKRKLAEYGAEAVTVAADVTDREALGAAIDEAAAQLGGLDVLVTSAASLAFGRFTETDPDDFEATVQTVLGGTVDTVRAALPHLEDSRGAIVCVGSIAGRMPLPGMSAYSASKHGLAGFLDTIRIELEEGGSSVTLSLVNPGAVDTPLWSNLESSTGLLPPEPPFPSVYSPESVAEAVLTTIRHPRDELTAGGLARAQVFFYSAFGSLGKRGMRALARLEHTAGDRPAGEGGLASGKGAGEVDGGFGGRPSVTVKALGAWDGMLRAIGRG
ncbi:MAG TPA: SDR family NAD(P)-dependent oxidoreductase [Solirubrobacterales bacterium]|nr:SDR family NAD(P)-dependent oxidoreductase [Solirubrobacterales bacterium]